MNVWLVVGVAELLAVGACAGRPPVHVAPALPADAGPPKEAKPHVANAEQTIADLRHEFKRCYDDGLRESPALSGTVSLSVQIGPEGNVASTQVVQLDGLTSGVVNCLVAATQSARFEPPGSEGSTLEIPLKFRPAEK